MSAETQEQFFLPILDSLNQYNLNSISIKAQVLRIDMHVTYFNVDWDNEP